MPLSLLSDTPNQAPIDDDVQLCPTPRIPNNRASPWYALVEFTKGIHSYWHGIYIRNFFAGICLCGGIRPNLNPQLSKTVFPKGSNFANWNSSPSLALADALQREAICKLLKIFASTAKNTWSYCVACVAGLSANEKMTTVQLLMMMMLSYSCWRFYRVVDCKRGKKRAFPGMVIVSPVCCTQCTVAVKAILNWNFCFLEAACRCCICFLGLGCIVGVTELVYAA